MQIDIRNITVYYINLFSDKRRNNRIVRQLRQRGFKKIIRVEAVMHSPSFLGVSMSHLKALRMGESSGYPFIILEDDIVFSDKVKFQLSLPDETDIFYLGVARSGRCYSCGQLSMGNGAKYEKFDNNLFHAVSLFCDHAKIYFSKESVHAQKRMILKSLQQRVPHDIFMWSECSELLCLTTRYPAVYQEDSGAKKQWKRWETLIDVEEYINNGVMEICDACRTS